MDQLQRQTLFSFVNCHRGSKPLCMQIGAALVNEKPQISTRMWCKSVEEAQLWIGRVMCYDWICLIVHII